MWRLLKQMMRVKGVRVQVWETDGCSSEYSLKGDVLWFNQ